MSHVVSDNPDTMDGQYYLMAALEKSRREERVANGDVNVHHDEVSSKLREKIIENKDDAKSGNLMVWSSLRRYGVRDEDDEESGYEVFGQAMSIIE